jgi:DNA helicase-2/ATP-dependent DNA helicase PcrA
MDAAKILDGLNEAQRAAVTSPANVLQVLAPPGSGKTKTLTARVAYLIAEHGLNPNKIIVCTFTNKAATEMRERITGFIGEQVAKQLVLGTFHRICRRFLSEFGPLIGLPKNFAIADTGDQKSIIKRIVSHLSLSADSTLPKTVQSRISSCKSKGQSVEQYLAAAKGQDKYEFAEIWGQYEQHLRTANLLDFDDLLIRTCDLLRQHPECVGGIQAVLVDEFQDTNNIQYNLMELFAQRRHVICIVGDPDQSIYGWRNAEIKNLKKMREQYPDTHVEILSENYRTSGAILHAAQEVIEQDEAREKKKLMATHSIGLPAVLRRLKTAEFEAQWVVFEIKRSLAMTGGLLDWNDYAILLRSASLSRQIESALGKEGIAYRMVGGSKFYDRLEVKLVLDYLRVISHPEHGEALLRVVNVPKRGIGDASLDIIIKAAEANKTSIWNVIEKIVQHRMKLEAKLSDQALKGLTTFYKMIKTAQKRLQTPPEEEDTLLAFLTYLIEKASITKYLKDKEKDNDSVDYDTRIANIQELVQQASEFSVAVQSGAYDEEALVQEHEEHATDLTEKSQDTEHIPGGLRAESTGSTEDILLKFLANVALATDSQKTGDGGLPKPMVTISTIHAAKGLEWPVVFIPAAYNGSIPHSRAEDNDEERRLLYVAMTRAQSLLYLSCPIKDQSRNDVTLSPFLSKQGMDSYLAKSGVSFTSDVVKEMSIILRRQCPAAAALGEIQVACEWPRDNKWPERHLEGEEEHRHWGTLGADLDEGKGFKRARFGMEEFGNSGRHFDTARSTNVPGFGFAITMTKQNSFSSARTTLPSTAGFVSAKDLKVEEPVKAKPEDSVAKETKAKASTTAAWKKRSKLVAADQGSLLSFFAKPASRSASRENSDLGEIDTSLAIETIPAQPPARLAKIPSNGLSSLLSEQRHIVDIDEAKENIPASDHSKSDGKTRPMPEVVPQTRPATTFHTTSMSSVVNSERLQKKTLGVKRSMNGWAARVHR